MRTRFGTIGQARAGFDLAGMDVVGGLDEVVHIHVAGLPGIHADEDASVLVDPLGGEVQRRCVSPMPVDDHQFLDAVFGHTHAHVVHQAGQGVVVDADGTLENASW